MPIGIVLSWKKENGVRVPIDDRQRLSAIDAFFSGRVAIPEMSSVPVEYRKKK